MRDLYILDVRDNYDAVALTEKAIKKINRGICKYNDHDNYYEYIKALSTGSTWFERRGIKLKRKLE